MPQMKVRMDLTHFVLIGWGSIFGVYANKAKNDIVDCEGTSVMPKEFSVGHSDLFCDNESCDQTGEIKWSASINDALICEHNELAMEEI
ncbi:hypothetical protein ACTXT7_016536 [Hymenolepis weldensis]